MRFFFYQNGKRNGHGVNVFDDVENGRAKYLNDREQVNSLCVDMSQIAVIWLIFGWHEQNKDPLEELSIFDKMKINK